MLKQEHGLIHPCTVSAVSASTMHTSLTLQREDDKEEKAHFSVHLKELVLSV